MKLLIDGYNLLGRSGGMNAVLVDPRRLVLKGGELRHEGAPIDVVYRNFEIADLFEWEAEGADIVMVNGAPIAKVGRSYRPSSRLELVE